MRELSALESFLLLRDLESIAVLEVLEEDVPELHLGRGSREVPEISEGKEKEE